MKQLIFKQKYPIYLYLIFLVTEIVTKFLDYKDFYYYRVSIVPKIIFLVLFLSSYTYQTIKNKNINTTFLSLIILTLFFFTSNLPYGIDHLINNTTYYTKYIFIFILILYLNSIPITTKHKLYILMEKFIIINSIIIIVSFLFNFEFAKTYLGGDRFGYNGLLYMNSQSSYIYILILTKYFLELKLTNRVKSKYVLVIIASLLTGTKATLIYLLLIGIYLFINLQLYKKIYLYIITFVFGVVIFSNTYFFSGKFLPLIELYRKHGLFTMLFSGRDLHLLNIVELLKNSTTSLINILFGGFPFFENRSEMGFIDVFLFFGLLGGLLFLYMYYSTIVKPFFKPNATFTSKYIIFSISVIVALGGNYFTNAVIAFYIIIVSEEIVGYLKSNNNSSITHKL